MSDRSPLRRVVIDPSGSSRIVTLGEAVAAINEREAKANRRRKVAA